MRRVLLSALALAGALVLSAAPPASAFDTGPHGSLTEDVLQTLGFNLAASNATQVENWLTDYYTSSPTIGSAAQCDLEKLHFDDVFSNADIAKYWSTFTANTKAATQQAERDNDVVEFYTVLGMSLHVVQDFYTHSNWVERNGAGGNYKTRTWFQTSSPPSGLYTGWYDNCLKIPQGNHVPHGGYTWGMNHDSVVRPNFDRAYVYALAASSEWTKNVLSWISPAFASKVKTYSPNTSDAADLAYDQKASLYISEWIQNPVNTKDLDGHWNGNRSGYAAAFAAFAAKWTASHNSVYVRTFKDKKIYATLSRNLYSANASPMPAFTAHATSGTVFAMRTLNVYANSAFTGTDSYFGELRSTIGGSHWYRDASQFHRPRTDVPWLQIMVVNSALPSISFGYSLWNEWNTTNNDMVPIQGSKKTLTFACRTSNASCVGDINGGPWTPSNPYVTKGSGINGVQVKLYFTATPAAP